MKTFLWILFGILAIGIGLYPLAFLPGLSGDNILTAKPEELKNSITYLTFFYLHISLGGVALLSGWTQFSKKIRAKRLNLHRLLGKIYVAAVTISGISGFIIAFNASGGLQTSLGFICLSIAWLITTLMAFVKVKQRNIDAHNHWMIRSYAVCFAAVTLRIYLPLFIGAFGMQFPDAYQIIAWLCWVPNLIVAEIIVLNLKKKQGSLKAA